MQATGWLGWPPDVAMQTHWVLIQWALDGKVEFVRKTNPFGSGEAAEPDKPPPPDKGPMTDAKRAKVAQDLKKYFRSVPKR
jgi:hypothetical protein